MNPEKKKAAVMVVLLVVVLGVGGFRLMDASSEPPAAPAKPKEAKPEENVDPNKRPPLNAGLPPLAQRDPFIQASFVNDGTDQPTTPPPTPQPDKKPVQGTHGQPKLGFDPKGTFGGDTGGTLPNPNTSKDTIPPMPVEKPIFGYSLVGVVDGAHPAAVFDDGKGNQQLVEVGQSIGPNAKILAIYRGKVRVKFNAETLTFNVGGNPNAK